MSYVGRVLSGFGSLLTGMRITFREFAQTLFRKKAVTMVYPKELPKLSPAYRSAIKLIRFEDTNTHDCVACKACERICPSFCIKLSGGKVEGIKKKRVAEFEMDFALCSLCGLCLDACPTDTLEYSTVYEEAGYNRDWRVDLLAEFRDYEPTFVEEQREREEAAAAEKKAKADAAKKAKEAKASAAAKKKESKEGAEAKPESGAEAEPTDEGTEEPAS